MVQGAELCGATPFRTLKLGLVVGDVAVLRSVATALPKCSKQGGWWGLMVVAQSGVSRSDVFLNSQIRAGGWGRWRYQSEAVAERHLSEFST